MAITPLMVDLEGKKIIIIGGGRVAYRRADTLTDSGAAITIISPEIAEGIRSLLENEKVTWRQKNFEPVDLEEAFLVIVATNNPEVNSSVVKACPPDSLLNVASDSTQGDVQFPSHLKRGKLTVSISTDGASPLLSSKIKKQLQTTFEEGYGDYVDFLYESRQLIKRSPLGLKERRQLLKELLSDEFLNSKKQRIAINWLTNLVERS
ncbi:NAD(P)-binding protein [Virgibacillus sp. DJP39]|uniref:NAD(P)-binding protein n=1 Tax=Virgibacillus sp. DJP39 TaxID=3409790 RepID=UPI003BB7E1E7